MVLIKRDKRLLIFNETNSMRIRNNDACLGKNRLQYNPIHVWPTSYLMWNTVMQNIWNQRQEYVDYSALYPNIRNFETYYSVIHNWQMICILQVTIKVKMVLSIALFCDFINIWETHAKENKLLSVSCLYFLVRNVCREFNVWPTHTFYFPCSVSCFGRLDIENLNYQCIGCLDNEHNVNIKNICKV